MNSTSSWKAKVPRSVMGGLWATALFAVLSNLALCLIDPILFFRVPNFLTHYWAVFPGAVLLSFVVLTVAGNSKWKAALVGGLLAPLNASFSVLLIISAWGVLGALGIMEPWRYGFDGLFGEWLHQQTTFLLLGAPIAVPCGTVMGWWLVRGSENGFDL